jgi:hypothetical protein
LDIVLYRMKFAWLGKGSRSEEEEEEDSRSGDYFLSLSV